MGVFGERFEEENQKKKKKKNPKKKKKVRRSFGTKPIPPKISL